MDPESLMEAGFNNFFSIVNYTVIKEEEDLFCYFICKVSFQIFLIP